MTPIGRPTDPLQRVAEAKVELRAWAQETLKELRPAVQILARLAGEDTRDAA